jgi:hypothetical protein
MGRTWLHIQNIIKDVAHISTLPPVLPYEVVNEVNQMRPHYGTDNASESHRWRCVGYLLSIPLGSARPPHSHQHPILLPWILPLIFE